MEEDLVKADYRKADCCEECKFCNSHIYCERNSAFVPGGTNMVCNYFERGNNYEYSNEKKDKKS